RPAPGRELRGPEGREDRGPRAVRPAHEEREAVGRNRLEPVLPHLEVPAGGVATVRPPDAPRPEAADRDTGELAVVDHRPCDSWMAHVGAGHADAPPPRLTRDLGPGGALPPRGGRLDRHFSTPVI